MHTSSKKGTITVLAITLVTLLGACGSDSSSSAGTPQAPADVTTAPTAQSSVSTPPAVTVPAVDTTIEPSPVATGGGSTSDPCSLLTASVAAQALGVAVGEPLLQPGQGNTTCAYHPADTAAPGFVYLTTYAVTGSRAVLDEAAKEFPDAKSVDGLGDAALVSVESQAVGVLTGQTVFALGLILQSPDGQLQPVDEGQLVAAARAVLDGQ